MESLDSLATDCSVDYQSTNHRAWLGVAHMYVLLPELYKREYRFLHATDKTRSLGDVEDCRFIPIADVRDVGDWSRSI